MPEDVFGPWRKSSYSAGESSCVEVAWRKSSRSGDEGNCVEVASIGAIRDSKNPSGPILRVDLPGLFAALTCYEGLLPVIE